MLINLRNALMAGKRLPYDAEVEYLESTGTQYIDTGKYPTYNTSISTTVLFDSSYANSYYIIFEARRAYLVDDFGILNFVGSDNQLQFRYGGNRYMSQPKLATDTVYEIRTEGRTLFVDGTPKIVAGSSTFSAPVTLKLFALDTNGTISPLSGVRIFRFAIYESGTLVRDYIPVRKGIVGYLYDRVSGKLFGNAGTGAFTYGNDLPYPIPAS